MNNLKHPKPTSGNNNATMTVLTIERSIEKNTDQLGRALCDRKAIFYKEISRLSHELLGLVGDLQCDIFKMPEAQREEHIKKSYKMADAFLSKTERNMTADQLLDLLNMNMTKQFRELWDFFQQYCESMELKYIWAQHKEA